MEQYDKWIGRLLSFVWFVCVFILFQAIKEKRWRKVIICAIIYAERKPSDAKRHLVFSARTSKRPAKQDREHEVRVCEYGSKERTKQREF